MKFFELERAISNEKARSAWSKGVKEYAFELIENLKGENMHDLVPNNRCDAMKKLLNGAANWEQYSEGGCSLVWDVDIAKRLCTPSGLKRTHCGERNSNCGEYWLNVQARALRQAGEMIVRFVTGKE